MREELEEAREGLAVYLAGRIVENNEKIERDPIELGLLEQDGNGKLHANARLR